MPLCVAIVLFHVKRGSVPIRRHRNRGPAQLEKFSTVRPTPCRPPRGYSVHAATGRCSTRTLKPRPWWLWRNGPIVASTSMYRQSDVSFCDLRSGSPPTRASSYMVAAISIDEDPAGTVSRETIIPTAATASREELHPASDEGSGCILRATVLATFSHAGRARPSEWSCGDPPRLRRTTGHRL